MGDKDEMIAGQNGALAEGEPTVEEIWEATTEEAYPPDEDEADESPAPKAKADKPAKEKPAVVDPT